MSVMSAEWHVANNLLKHKRTVIDVVCTLHCVHHLSVDMCLYTMHKYLRLFCFNRLCSVEFYLFCSSGND